MVKSKKRRKVIIFSVIGVVLVALTLVAIFKKGTGHHRSDGKGCAPQSHQHRRGQRQNPARRAGHHQPGSQRRNHRTAGQGRPAGQEGRFAGEDQPGHLRRRGQPGQGRLRILARRQGLGDGEPGKSRGGLRAQPGIVPPEAAFGIGLHRVQIRPRRGQGATRQRRRPGQRGQGQRGQRRGAALPDHHRFAARRHHQQIELATRRARAGHRAKCRDRHHDHLGSEPDGGPRGRRRDGRGGHQARPEGAAGSGRVQGPQILRHGDGRGQFIEGQQPDRQLFQQQQPVAGSHQVPGAHPAQRQGRLPPRHVRQRRH